MVFTYNSISWTRLSRKKVTKSAASAFFGRFRSGIGQNNRESQDFRIFAPLGVKNLQKCHFCPKMTRGTPIYPY